MPSLEDLAPAFILGFFAIGLVLERVFAARPLPKVRGWWLRASISFVSTIAVNAIVPALVAERFAALSLFQLRSWGTVAGAGVALVCSDFAGYWLHRAQHRSPAFWRWTHQMHHSAERVDVIGAAYFHPLDIAVQGVVSTAVVALLGVTPTAAALAGIVGVLLAVFQHLNVRTPAWVGYLVQRPEGHSVHHARGVHAYNYGNLALCDLLFGTFRNPREFSTEAGFYEGASARVGAMLLGRDIQA
ncbi:MAG TPA: sterol desaturase family protein [Polyangiaceae bacterium]|jgi:sterol desaturase/sphingolipid hydroxylase (fatty acid hydroxylase superfamily)